jgi:hypothetical protein
MHSMLSQALASSCKQITAVLYCMQQPARAARTHADEIWRVLRRARRVAALQRSEYAAKCARTTHRQLPRGPLNDYMPKVAAFERV